MVSKIILLEGLNRFHRANLTFNSDVGQDTDIWFAWKTPNFFFCFPLQITAATAM